MSTTVAALRGAITLERDEREHMLERVTRLLTEIMDRNGLEHDDLISILFTATDDLHSAFPALAARQLGMAAITFTTSDACVDALHALGVRC